MRTFFTLVSMLVATATLQAGPAGAASSGWVETEGARIRLLIEDAANADGRLRGALQIELKPGWKTYWRDPGDAGVPPSLDFTGSTNVRQAELHFPAPRRFQDQVSSWAGYDQAVSLPITLDLADAPGTGTVKASAFLGVCEKICIPVQATFQVATAAVSGTSRDQALVEAAFMTLPGNPSAAFGVTSIEQGPESLDVSVAVPGDPSAAELFVAGSDGYSLGAPTRIVKDGRPYFAIPVLSRPREATAASLPYTLVSNSGAVSGMIELR